MLCFSNRMGLQKRTGYQQRGERSYPFLSSVCIWKRGSLKHNPERAGAAARIKYIVTGKVIRILNICLCFFLNEILFHIIQLFINNYME